MPILNIIETRLSSRTRSQRFESIALPTQTFQATFRHCPIRNVEAAKSFCAIDCQTESDYKLRCALGTAVWAYSWHRMADQGEKDKIEVIGLPHVTIPTQP